MCVDVDALDSSTCRNITLLSRTGLSSFEAASKSAFDPRSGSSSLNSRSSIDLGSYFVHAALFRYDVPIDKNFKYDDDSSSETATGGFFGTPMRRKGSISLFNNNSNNNSSSTATRRRSSFSMFSADNVILPMEPVYSLDVETSESDRRQFEVR